jgi:hypothetical protein
MKALILFLGLLPLSCMSSGITCNEIQVPVYQEVKKSDITNNPVGKVFNFVLGQIVSPGSYSVGVNSANQIIDRYRPTEEPKIIGYKIEKQCVLTPPEK